MKRLIITSLIAILSLGAQAQTREQLMGKAAVSDTTVWKTRGGFTLLIPTYAAYDKMAAAAAKDGITLSIVSAFRSFSHQKRIWERKWNDKSRAKLTPQNRALNILKYSSMPSTSRHHWGTDFDLNSVSPEYFETKQGRKIYDWLVANASKFGFFQPYTAGRSKGYATEKWHWSYAAIADRYEKAYLETIKNEDIKGFLGSEIAPKIDMINGWVKIR